MHKLLHTLYQVHVLVSTTQLLHYSYLSLFLFLAPPQVLRSQRHEFSVLHKKSFFD